MNTARLKVPPEHFPEQRSELQRKRTPVHMIPKVCRLRSVSGMLSIEGTLERQRRRGQNEINVLVRDFSESGLSQKEFGLKGGVHPLTVARWVESCSGKPITDGPASTSPASPFVAGQLRSKRPVPNTADLDWPEVVAPGGWKLRVPLGAE
jgi:hypothetical protein